VILKCLSIVNTKLQENPQSSRNRPIIDILAYTRFSAVIELWYTNSQQLAVTLTLQNYSSLAEHISTAELNAGTVNGLSAGANHFLYLLQSC